MYDYGNNDDSLTNAESEYQRVQDQLEKYIFVPGMYDLKPTAKPNTYGYEKPYVHTPIKEYGSPIPTIKMADLSEKQKQSIREVHGSNKYTWSEKLHAARSLYNSVEAGAQMLAENNAHGYKPWETQKKDPNFDINTKNIPEEDRYFFAGTNNEAEYQARAAHLRRHREHMEVLRNGGVGAFTARVIAEASDPILWIPLLGQYLRASKMARAAAIAGSAAVVEGGREVALHRFDIDRTVNESLTNIVLAATITPAVDLALTNFVGRRVPNQPTDQSPGPTTPDQQPGPSTPDSGGANADPNLMGLKTQYVDQVKNNIAEYSDDIEAIRKAQRPFKDQNIPVKPEPLRPVTIFDNIDDIRQTPDVRVISRAVYGKQGDGTYGSRLDDIIEGETTPIGSRRVIRDRSAMEFKREESLDLQRQDWLEQMQSMRLIGERWRDNIPGYQKATSITKSGVRFSSGGRLPTSISLVGRLLGEAIGDNPFLLVKFLEGQARKPSVESIAKSYLALLDQHVAAVDDLWTTYKQQPDALTRSEVDIQIRNQALQITSLDQLDDNLPDIIKKGVRSWVGKIQKLHDDFNPDNKTNVLENGVLQDIMNQLGRLYDVSGINKQPNLFLESSKSELLNNLLVIQAREILKRSENVKEATTNAAEYYQSIRDNTKPTKQEKQSKDQQSKDQQSKDQQSQKQQSKEQQLKERIEQLEKQSDQLKVNFSAKFFEKQLKDIINQYQQTPSFNTITNTIETQVRQYYLPAGKRRDINNKIERVKHALEDERPLSNIFDSPNLTRVDLQAVIIGIVDHHVNKIAKTNDRLQYYTLSTVLNNHLTEIGFPAAWVNDDLRGIIVQRAANHLKLVKEFPKIPPSKTDLKRKIIGDINEVNDSIAKNHSLILQLVDQLNVQVNNQSVDLFAHKVLSNINNAFDVKPENIFAKPLRDLYQDNKLNTLNFLPEDVNTVINNFKLSPQFTSMWIENNSQAILERMIEVYGPKIGWKETFGDYTLAQLKEMRRLDDANVYRYNNINLPLIDLLHMFSTQQSKQLADMLVPFIEATNVSADQLMRMPNAELWKTIEETTKVKVIDYIGKHNKKLNNKQITDMVNQAYQTQNFTQLVASVPQNKITKLVQDQLKNDLIDIEHIYNKLFGITSDSSIALTSDIATFTKRVKQVNRASKLMDVVTSSASDLARPLMILGFVAYAKRVFNNIANSQIFYKIGLNKGYDRAFQHLAAAGEVTMQRRAKQYAQLDNEQLATSNLGKGVDKADDWLMQATGLPVFNRWMKTVVGQLIIDKIMLYGDKLSRGVIKDIPKNDKLTLANIGANVDFIQQVYPYLKQHGITKRGIDDKSDLLVDPNITQWTSNDSSHIALGNQLQYIIKRAADLYINTPGAASLPIFFDNKVMSLMTQFKSFLLLAHQQTLIPALQSPNARFLQYATAAIMIGGMIAWYKQSVADLHKEKKRDFDDILLNAVDRSGVVPLAFEADTWARAFGVPLISGWGDAERQRYAYQHPLVQIAGPWASYLQTAKYLAKMMNPNQTITEGELRNIIYSIPGARHPVLRSTVTDPAIPVLKEALED